MRRGCPIRYTDRCQVDATPAIGDGRYGVYSRGRSHIRNSTEVKPARARLRATAPTVLKRYSVG